MADGIENRCEHRMNIALPVFFKKIDNQVEKQQEHEGIVANISNNGVYFCCTNCSDIEINHHLDITIKIPSLQKEATNDRILKIQGEVTRIQRFVSDPYSLGVALKFQNGLDSILFC